MSRHNLVHFDFGGRPSAAAWRAILTLAILLTTGRILHGQVDISEELEPIRSGSHLPGLSALALKGGRAFAWGAAGVRRQGDPERLRVTDRINIGSCTKWMTATLAGRLVDRGLIRWNSRVSDVFANARAFQPAFQRATLDQLLMHRAGVQQGSTFESRHWAELQARDGTMRQVRRWVSETVLKEPPEVPPGEYLYSNQGYAVVASMLEIVTGKDWETLLREEVLTPARMESAIFGQVYDDRRPPFAPVGHDLKSGEATPVPRVAMTPAQLEHYQAAAAPGGFVACTLADWSKFLRLVSLDAGGRYLRPETARRLQAPYSPNAEYGRGVLSVERDWARPGRALHHAGDIFGENSVFWMAPARDFVIVIFTNCRSADGAVGNALDEVARLLVGRFSRAQAGPGEPAPAAPPPAAPNKIR